MAGVFLVSIHYRCAAVFHRQKQSPLAAPSTMTQRLCRFQKLPFASCMSKNKAAGIVSANYFVPTEKPSHPEQKTTIARLVLDDDVKWRNQEYDSTQGVN